MRTRELRLRRTLRRIALLALAAPAPGVAACQVAGGDAKPPPDASAEHEPDAAPPDADASDGETPDAAPSCAPYAIGAADAGDDAPDGCADFHLFPCGLPDAAQVMGCYLDSDTCGEQCLPGPFLYFCEVPPISCDPTTGFLPDAAAIIECVRCAVGGGRRPLGLLGPQASPVSPVSPVSSARTPAGDYFASMAYLESASVRAFRDLERWLLAEGAPLRLARASRRAAGDERRHARAAARLARRFGARPPRPRVRRGPSPSLLELLEDDIVEGCVGETFGALLLTWQAEHAEDARVRRTLRSIALDETRHAALAWEILYWGAPRLDPRERLRLRRTLDDALASLEHRAPVAVPEAARRASGHPPPDEERRLARDLACFVREEAERTPRSC